ncbi:MAG: haloacid dehalogenase type II, partial [Candidatus Bathyarchaeia archaeon]
IPPVKAIVFDVFGTLYDVSSVMETAKKIIPNPDPFVTRWRAKQLEYSFLSSMMGRFENFWEITRKSLTFTANSLGVTIDEKNRQTLMDAWAMLIPYPEVTNVLSSLKSKKPLAVLSNGDRNFLDRLLKNTGLTNFFTQVLSADEVRKYKPAPEVYALAAERLAVGLGEILMVSSNSFDVVGSKASGMKCCWVRRSSVPLDELGVQPDAEVADLTALSG